MLWPTQPVERIPAQCFEPRHCPWERCRSNHEGGAFRFVRHGVFIRTRERRAVPRFRCRTCGRTFSQQTFAFSYYLKRAELAQPVACGLLAGSAHRQLARSLGCAPSTVTRMAARLGRHALLLLARGLEHLDGISEPIVYDDFESFFVSQDLPCGFGTPVGQRTWFVYGLDHAVHRRAAPRRRGLKPPMHKAVEPERGAYTRAFRRTVDLLISRQHGTSAVTLVTDDHPGYRGGLRSHPERHRIEHRVFANPTQRPSAEARRRDREMFPVDLLHNLMRHSLAHHRRETIAFGRRLNALLERGFLMAVWRNWIKLRSERRPRPETPAMWLGLAREPWSWARLLARRLFPWRLTVPAHWMTVYRRGLTTPEIGPNTRHDRVYAF